MNTRLDNFNNLPPKPEHSRKVNAVLSKGKGLPVSDIITATGLTKTQVLCALDPMVRSGQVRKEKDSSAFSIVGDSTT